MLRAALVLSAVLGLAAGAVGIAVAVDRAFFTVETRSCPPRTVASTHPELQRILDGLVAGPSALAPGATAYVSGPHGSWLGAAGVADASTCAPMTADARMRLESVSKIYTATLVLQLAQEGSLRVDDTVSRWLPRLLPSYGDRITIRQLLTMSSGLIDNNDFVNASERRRRTYLARVGDPALRAQLLATAERVEENPATMFPELLWIRWAAWQPLLFPPGLGHHYSNIGYDILGLVAARAGGRPLPTLFRERIFEPLGLRATAYDPQGPIGGRHARGYGIDAGGAPVDTTDWHAGVGAEGGIVADARDTGTFLAGLMRGDLLGREQLRAMEWENLWRGGEASGCAGQAYGWSGGGSGFKTEVWVADGGNRVAVLLLNARHLGPSQVVSDAAAHRALADLYCAA